MNEETHPEVVVSATDAVTVRVRNVTAANLTPAFACWKVTVLKT